MSQEAEWMREDQPIDLDDVTANYSIPQLVSHLKGAYKDTDFMKVEIILMEREADMCNEIERLKMDGEKREADLRSEIERLKMVGEKREAKMRKMVKRAEIKEAKFVEAVASNVYTMEKLKKLKCAMRGMRKRNVRLSEAIAVLKEKDKEREELINDLKAAREEVEERVEALEKRNEEIDICSFELMKKVEERVEVLEKKNEEMGIWDFELRNKVEELMAEASVWSDWREKVAEMIGVNVAAATGEEKLRKVANEVNETGVCDGDLVGRLDAISSGEEKCGNLGSKGGPFSFRNAATDPKMSQVPFQAREESGIRCSPSVDKNEKIYRGLSTQKSKKAYMSSFFPPSSSWVAMHGTLCQTSFRQSSLLQREIRILELIGSLWRPS